MSDEQKRNIELEIKEAMEIDDSDILGELMRHSSKYFYYGVLWAKASKQKRKQRLKLKEAGARLANQLRAQAAEEDPKARVTEAMINNFLYNHPEYLQEESNLIQYEYMEEVLDIARDGMKQRGMALNELAKQARAEDMYGDEFKAMRKEFDGRVEDVPKKKRKKRELDPVIDPNSGAEGDV